jgi:cephalosporin-C deacetylase-like acetyl esterase
MTSNLALPWNDLCSQPQNPYLAFYSTQRDDLMFDKEDRIELRCQAGLRAVSLKWTLHRNLINTPFREGMAEPLPGNKFAIRLDSAGLHPGFYELRVELDTGVTSDAKEALAKRPVRGVCVFGWRAEKMALADSRPTDFTPFWDQAKASLAKIPLDAHEGPTTVFAAKEIDAYNVASAYLPPDYDPAGHRVETVESCKVDFAGPAGGRVYGWMAKPAPQRAEGSVAGPEGKGPFPAMLILPGAGNNARPRPLEHARHGYLALDIQVHGQDVDLEKYSVLDEKAALDPGDPRIGYSRAMYLRCLQAINYLSSRPDVDPNRIVVVGGSQGGRLGIVVAALDPRVKAVVAAIAHYGNHPYQHWTRGCNARRTGDGIADPALAADGMGLSVAPPVADDATSRREAYYDPMNFAPDVRCAVLMSAGLIDPVSPPVCVFAIYNRLGTAKKTMVPLDGLGHDWSAEFDRHAWRWLDGVLGIAPGASETRQ